MRYEASIQNCRGRHSFYHLPVVYFKVHLSMEKKIQFSSVFLCGLEKHETKKPNKPLTLTRRSFEPK